MVIKFLIRNFKDYFFQVLIELGKKLEPGSGDGEFCKPTSVAVLPSGEFFVADGYCNSRIIKYSKAGVKISTWSAGTSIFQLQFLSKFLNILFG